MPKAKKVKSDKVQIQYNWDDSCEMEELLVNGETICYGNEWDYHGDDQLEGIKQTLDLLKIPYEVTIDKTWKCAEGDHDEDEDLGEEE